MAEPAITTIKRLFALSGNRCAFPGCQNRIVDAFGILIGRVCHICADKPGGKRYDPNQSDQERQGFDNLILLCANHHIVIDDDDVTYTAKMLRQMKRRHEESVTERFGISDEMAKRIILVISAGVAGAAIGEVVRGVADFARALANAVGPQQTAGKRKPVERTDPLLRELENILRYAPKGVVAYDSEDEGHKKIGAFFSDVFKRGGWRPITLRIGPSTLAPGTSALRMVFLLRDPNQVHNAHQAINQVFSRCGFRSSDEHGGQVYRSEDATIRIYIHIGTMR